MEELILALENRITLGEDRESLRAEVLSHGHSEVVFDEAYAAATQRVAEKSQNPASITTSQTQFGQSRVRGNLHTLEIEARPNALISYIDMLRAGWYIGNESRSVIGGVVAALLLLFPLVLVGFLILASLAATLEESPVTILALVALAVIGYFGIVLYATTVGFAFFRGILKRHEPKAMFWPHFRWAWANVMAVILVSFYVQVITQAGFVLFIIPGVMASIYLGYAFYVLADEEVRGFDALIRSFEMVYGRFWGILGRKFFLILVVLVAALPVGFATAVFPPAGILIVLGVFVGGYYIICSTVALYESVQSLPITYVFSEKERTTIKMWLRIVVAAGLALALYSLYNSAMSLDQDSAMADFRNFLSEVDGEVSEEPYERPHERELAKNSLVLIKSEIDIAQNEAQLYFFANNDSYRGVCSSPDGINTQMRYAFDAGAANVMCEDDQDWFIAEAELLDTGVYYCIDSLGNAVERTDSRKGFQSCAEVGE